MFFLGIINQQKYVDRASRYLLYKCIYNLHIYVFKCDTNNKNNVLRIFIADNLLDYSSNDFHNAQFVSRISNNSMRNGYDRAAFLRHACLHSKNGGKATKTVRVSYDPTYKVLFCPLCKTASTFWTRVFKMVQLNSNGVSKKLETPFDVPIAQAPRSELYYDLAHETVTQFGNASDAFKFLFVRSPYGMLYSAYVDKIVGPNPTYWNAFGQPAVKQFRRHTNGTCGSDVTFEEFLRYVVHMDKSGRQLDCHVARFDNCQPCRMDYTYVATMETFKDDTFYILSKLNQTQTLNVFETKFSKLHAYDAIDDSISGPYLWKSRITRCMSWHEALQRIWRKLQLRGVILNSAKFPLNEDQSNNTTKSDFISIAFTAWGNSTSTERTKQKKEEYIKTFQEVPVDVLDSIRRVYEREFKLFGYDDRPNELFNRG